MKDIIVLMSFLVGICITVSLTAFVLSLMSRFVRASEETASALAKSTRILEVLADEIRFWSKHSTEKDNKEQ